MFKEIKGKQNRILAMAHWGGGYLSSVPNCKLNGNLE